MINPWHFIMIIPAAYQDDINACGMALAYGPTNFSVPLTTLPDTETVTHYACCAPGSDGFKGFCEQASIGNLPAGVAWEDYGLTEEQAATAFANAIFDIEESGLQTPKEHFDAAIAVNGLALKEVDL